MLFRMVGSALIILSCSMIGFIVSVAYKIRPALLRNLQMALSMLETEIKYGHSPLPEAMKNIGRRCEREVSRLFLDTMKYMSSRAGMTAGEAWDKALSDFYVDSYLKREDKEILSAFGKYLGSSDIEDQIKNIKLTINNLRQQEIIANEEKRQNERLWKYLGVLSGIMVVLLLY